MEKKRRSAKLLREIANSSNNVSIILNSKYFVELDELIENEVYKAAKNGNFEVTVRIPKDNYLNYFGTELLAKEWIKNGFKVDFGYIGQIIISW